MVSCVDEQGGQNLGFILCQSERAVKNHLSVAHGFNAPGVRNLDSCNNNIFTTRCTV